MAVTRKPRSEKAQSNQPDLERTSLAGALGYALARLELIEGGRDTAAARLSERLVRRSGALSSATPEVVERWIARGVPSDITADPVVVAQVLTEVAAMGARHDRTEPLRERRRQRLAYSGLLEPHELGPNDDPAIAARVKKLDQVRTLAALKKLAARRVKEEAELGKKRSEVSVLADELRVRPEDVRRWLDRGEVSQAGVGVYRRHMAEQKALEGASKNENRVFQRLLSAGRKKAYETVVSRYYDKKTGRQKVHKQKRELPRVPVFRRSEGYYGGDNTSGYRWGFPMRDYLTPTLIAKIVRQAMTLPLDKMRRAIRRALPEWRMTIIVSVLYGKDRKSDSAHPIKTAAGYVYGSNVRLDLHEQFPEEGNRFVVADAYSGGNAPTQKEATAQLESRMWKELGTGDRIWVHGLVVRYYRRRTENEQLAVLERKALERKLESRRGKRVKKEKDARKLSRQGRAAREAFERQQAKKGK